MLRFTSCLFATIVLNTHMQSTYRTVRMDGYHHLFLAVTVLSILFHSTHDPRVGILDRIFAHTAFLFVLWTDSKRAIAQGKPWLLLFPLAVACLWLAQAVWPRRADALHAGLHLVTVMGVNSFIIGLMDDDSE